MPHTASGSIRRLLIAAPVTFGLGLVLFAAVRLDAAATADEHLTAAIHQFAVGHPAISQIAQVLTVIGDPLILVILVAVSAALLFVAHHRRLAVWLLVVTTGGAIIETGLKLVIRRARPDVVDVMLEAHGTSFPSGHAMNTTIFLGAVVLVFSAASGATRGTSKVLLAFAASVSIVVAATRILLGVHYLSDVVVGIVLALFWLALTRPLIEGPSDVGWGRP